MALDWHRNCRRVTEQVCGMCGARRWTGAVDMNVGSVTCGKEDAGTPDRVGRVP